jgi:hypothetical protein
VHFLDSWTELPPLDLLRLLAPVALLAAGGLLPGRRIARLTAIAVALFIPALRELGPWWPWGAAWTALWLGVAWRVGETGPAQRAGRPRAGGVESGAVGLLLGLVLLALLVAGVARQNLSHADGRLASYGLLVMCLGLLHLMLRRDARRALVGFAALGLGLQLLEGVSRAALIVAERRDPGAILVATLAAVALADRLARVRQLDAGSAWVSDAHDLHD